jgi:hypothetical protein
MRGEDAAWDTWSDTWAATDALQRRVTTHEEVGPPRGDRFVGIFYFLWHGAQVDGGPWDISRILANDPEAMRKKGSPPWGPMHAMHHWGEPLFGHYLGDDPWVLRRHAAMLAAAGVDTLIFDTSNRLIFEHNYTALFDVLTDMRREGNATPDVAFLAPFWDPGSTVRQLYDRLYGRGLFENLWFLWEDKPLILANPEQVDPGIRGFFTFRRPQPSYHHGPVHFDENGYYPELGPRTDMWAWLEVTPQHVFCNTRGEKEEMAVGVAQNAIRDPRASPTGDSVGLRTGSMSEAGSLGRSFHVQLHRDSPDAVRHGYNFAEQWERALREDPRFIFVTGWNEWLGERLDDFMGIQEPVLFVDTCDQEHSRDIEPMKGGHGDDYYYQLVHFIRRFKGARPLPPASAATTIDLEGPFAQWDDVRPDYRDTIGDTVHRDHPGYAAATRYVNTSGRNDFVLMKVARDSRALYFYARTRELITPFSDSNWMMLFIDIDGDTATGWHGYDFVVNRRVRDADTTVLEYTRTGWNWQPRADVCYRVDGCEMMLAIPRESLGIPPGEDDLRFEFKWADNIQNDDSIDEFTINGDAAPFGRFNYRYRSGGT